MANATSKGVRNMGDIDRSLRRLIVFEAVVAILAMGGLGIALASCLENL